MKLVDKHDPSDLMAELTRTREELAQVRAQATLTDGRSYDSGQPRFATPAVPPEAPDNPAAAVLEHIYRDMMAALQQMYHDTISAKDDALASRDRELGTKDVLIQHLTQRAEDAEGRASQALRYIGELERIEAHDTPSPSNSAHKRRGVSRFFRK